MFIRQISSAIKNNLIQSQRPVDPTFFTGNPHYYNLLMKMNDLLREYNIPFQQDSHILQTDRWMIMTDIERQMDMRLSKDAYNDLIYKLDRLSEYADKNPKINELIHPFFKSKISVPKFSRDVKEFAVDNDGKALGIGSRKTAQAQAWVMKGTGEIFINGRPLHLAISRKQDRLTIVRGLAVAQVIDQFNVWAVVKDGGNNCQVEAVSLAINRALCSHFPDLKEPFTELKLLEQDLRLRERKKSGQPGARKKHRWVKR